jgi:hypothetical protein
MNGTVQCYIVRAEFYAGIINEFGIAMGLPFTEYKEFFPRDPAVRG